MIIGTFVGHATDCIGTGILEVNSTKMNEREDNVAIAVILAPSAALHFFSPARVATGKGEA